MPRPFRLLISARDPGAANYLAPVAHLAATSPEYELTLVAAEPARQIFHSLGLTPEKISASEDALPDAATNLIARSQPDAILTGLSGPDRGIDEALLAASNDIPTWALQDFWGDVNKGFGSYADTYLVRDQLAARLTRQRASANTIIVGSPIGERPPVAWRQQLMANRLRRAEQVPPGKPLVVLCSQPLWEQPGYHDTLRQVLQNLPPCKLLVRMHPKETQLERRRLQKLLRRFCRSAWHICDKPLPELLAGSDLQVSAFSNTGLDQLRFNKRAPSLSAIPVYLLQHPKLERLFKQWTGLDQHPLCELGAASRARGQSSLGSTLTRALEPGTRWQSTQRSRHPLRDGSAEDVLATIASRSNPPKSN